MGGDTALESTVILNWSRNPQFTKPPVMGNLSSAQSPVNNSAHKLLQTRACHPRTHSSSACTDDPGRVLCYVADVNDSGSFPGIPKASSVRRGKTDTGSSHTNYISQLRGVGLLTGRLWRGGRGLPTGMFVWGPPFLSLSVVSPAIQKKVL